MKQSTVESLRKFTDPEQIGNGRLRDRIELLEMYCERCGNAEVPWDGLVTVCVMSDWEVSVAGPVEVMEVEGDKDPGDVGLDAKPSDDALMRKRHAMAIARAAKAAKKETVDA